MEFDAKLIQGKLVRRYKRFLADVALPSGEVVAHCPNPGAMTGLADEGITVWLEPNDDPKKKLKYGWRYTQLPSGLVGIDTSLANKIVREALTRGSLKSELSLSGNVRPEQKYGEGSRVDFLIEGARATYLEVKSVTLSRQAGLAEFPDTVTKRGAKHLRELAAVAAQGHRAILFFLVMRSDCDAVSVAGDIDPDYLSALQDALGAGIEIVAYGAQMHAAGARLGPRLRLGF